MQNERETGRSGAPDGEGGTAEPRRTMPQNPLPDESTGPAAERRLRISREGSPEGVLPGDATQQDPA